MLGAVIGSMQTLQQPQASAKRCEPVANLSKGRGMFACCKIVGFRAEARTMCTECTALLHLLVLGQVQCQMCDTSFERNASSPVLSCLGGPCAQPDCIQDMYPQGLQVLQ